MKKLLSTKYSQGGFNFSMFILRVTLGVLLTSHGYDKLVHFAEMKGHFFNFLGLGSVVSLCLAIFAEFFCSLFLILGLFTRFAAIPIVIMMGVVVFMVTHGQILGPGERGAIYLAAALTVLFNGPGKISLDSILGK
ncbi:MAG: DoxX family protein [Bacteroidota bacterium]|nr:DoxX family protein [Bacteroidota bacterium]